MGSKELNSAYNTFILHLTEFCFSKKILTLGRRGHLVSGGPVGQHRQRVRKVGRGSRGVRRSDQLKQEQVFNIDIRTMS